VRERWPELRFEMKAGVFADGEMSDEHCLALRGPRG